MPIVPPSELADEAGVDPWKLLESLESGDPAQIENLASAFLTAGTHMAAAHEATQRARTDVRNGYTVNGNSPIDAGHETATADSGLKDGNAKDMATRKDHLARIGKILDGVGSDLVAATKSAASEVTSLNSALSKIDGEYNTWYTQTGHAAPDNVQINVMRSYITREVQATQTSGQAVKKHVTAYETQLHTALKSMAHLGYLPPDDLDEGPGDVDLNIATGSGAGQATVAAAKSRNKAALQRSTFGLSLVNEAVKHNRGRVSDAELQYLEGYYGQTAQHSDVIAAAVKHAHLQHSVGSQYADGFLNMTRGVQQPTDGGLAPDATSPTGAVMGRGGLEGLPQSVQNVLHSDLGVVKDTGGQDMRRAEYIDGHWVIRNYGNDSGFAWLLTQGSKGVVGGTEFSQALGEAGLRWKQELNTVDHNTQTWLTAGQGRPDHDGAPDIDPKDIKLPDGFAGKHDHNGNPINNDELSSDALQTLSRNEAASSHFLLNTHDRRTLLGLNWNHGDGAGDVITSGTAPDPTGKSDRNEATLKVMQDAGHDYKNLDGLASPAVKTALTLVATRHIDTFAQDIPPGADPGDGLTITGPDGKPEHGVFLNTSDMANYLKLVSGFGANDYGLLHAAAMERGSQYIAHGMQTGGAQEGEDKTMASLLNARVTNAGIAAANDTLRANIDGHGRHDAAALLAEQKAATDSWLGQLGKDGLGIVLGGAALVAPEAAGPAIAAMSFVSSTAGTVQGDLGGPSGPDPALSQAVQHIYDDLKGVSAIPSQTAQAALDTYGNEQWMAVRAQNLLPDSYLHAHPLTGAELRAHTEAAALSGADGVPKPGFGFTPGSDVSTKVNDITTTTYGSDKGLSDTSRGYEEDLKSDGQNQSWGGGTIDHDQRSVDSNSGAWGSGRIQHSITYGGDSTYRWVRGTPMSPREPAWAAYHFDNDPDSPK